MADFPIKLAQKLKQRSAENAMRVLAPMNSLVDFSSNDYLGFAKEQWIADRAKEILELGKFKNGATGSRLLSGNHELYEELENFLIDFHCSEAALVFNSGYDANLGFFGSVPQRGDFIFYDELAHASIRDGIGLSNAKAYKFNHANLEDLKRSIKQNINDLSHNAEVYIVTESVFSMDGDTPNLKELATFCSAANYRLIVDEAHASGIFGNGKGLCITQGIDEKVFARIVTFGKALGCHGAAILGSKDLKQYLINYARSFIYTTALPPHTIASILGAYDFLNSPQGKINRQRLLENSSYFKQELEAYDLYSNFIESNSAIQCIKIEGNNKVKEVSNRLKRAGFNVKAILSPTVPKGKERLRFCLHAYNTKEEIKSVIQILKEI